MNRQEFINKVGELGINLTEEQLNQLDIYCNFLLEYNSHTNLTAIKEEILPIDRVVIYILNTLDKYYNNILKDRYGIDKVDNEEIEETLEAIGRKRGCLIRGGIVDYDKVYSVVMNDIKNGIIKGITFDRYE